MALVSVSKGSRPGTIVLVDDCGDSTTIDFCADFAACTPEKPENRPKRPTAQFRNEDGCP